jgi:hypothetical protein
MRTLRLEQQPLLLITTITATGQLETTLSSLMQQHTGKISLLLPFRSLPDNEKSYAAAANHSLETTRRAEGRVWHGTEIPKERIRVEGLCVADGNNLLASGGCSALGKWQRLDFPDWQSSREKHSSSIHCKGRARGRKTKAAVCWLIFVWEQQGRLGGRRHLPQKQ